MRTATPLRTWSTIDRVGPVGHLGGDLDAPVHRARVHDDGAVGLGRSARAAVEPVAGGVLAQRWAPAPRSCARAACAAGRRRRPVGSTSSRSWLTVTGQPSRLGGSSVGGADERDLGAERGEGQHVGAGDPAVLDVADDGDAPPVERAEPLADRVAVEQGLGRVLVPAVAGVDHRRRSPTGRPARARRPSRGARRWRRRPWPRSSGPCRGATRPSSPTTCRR